MTGRQILEAASRGEEWKGWVPESAGVSKESLLGRVLILLGRLLGHGGRSFYSFGFQFGELLTRRFH